MFRPRFEKPVDSAKDVVQRNITLFFHQYFIGGLKSDMLALNVSEWTHIAENMVSVKVINYDVMSMFEYLVILGLG